MKIATVTSECTMCSSPGGDLHADTGMGLEQGVCGVHWQRAVSCGTLVISHSGSQSVFWCNHIKFCLKSSQASCMCLCMLKL